HFEKKGYNQSFVENMTNVIEKLQNGEKILIVTRADDICKACPNVVNGECKCQHKVKSIDEKCLKECSVCEGDILSWSDFDKKIKTNIIAKNKLPNVCGDCEWLYICNP
ncbi:MAG: DUF1284 domain-containing protein, partial [Oscillospiraceae bacterium]